MDRTQHEWNVTLQRDDGQVIQHTLRAYWNPEQEGCTEAVLGAARAEAFMAANKQHEFHPISAALVA